MTLCLKQLARSSAKRGTVLEVALNGPWGPPNQPKAPYRAQDIVDEGIRCASAGANVIHVHPYDDGTLTQNDDLETYVRIIEGIRERVDVIVYPTAPFMRAASGPRYAVTEALAKRGLIEWATIDPGSTNVVRKADLSQTEPGFVYENKAATLREGLEVCAIYGVRPAYAIYEPGFMRLGQAMASRFASLPAPLYRLMFSTEFLFGLPPCASAMDSYEALAAQLDLDDPIMIGGLGVDILPLVANAVARGWHVRVGLEDAPFGCEMSNVALVEAAVSLIDRAGGTMAAAGQLLAVASTEAPG
ncbi:3-keto-5-aminohexanoate cleavage protein [Tianweitania sediminis]|uniref:3-keto-5-aminohexanoate cleavage protein n=1 Tax=Tianweitania sediminis TaxID=1502156 RepID=A0A8J7ULZ5_9HYPH|nr:3-keto-5-aminohexanoate cleavage protein [Tianweitania sediminis]MBP0441465.1 3-keto-5-aminohexanoate cleavage protein [Tianweitania sediminis]